MGGRFEVRYYVVKNKLNILMPCDYITEYTNSFLRFLKLMVTKQVIYFKIICE